MFRSPHRSRGASVRTPSRSEDASSSFWAWCEGAKRSENPADREVAIEVQRYAVHGGNDEDMRKMVAEKFPNMSKKHRHGLFTLMEKSFEKSKE